MSRNEQCGFRTGLTQTDLYKHRIWPETGKFGFRIVLSYHVCRLPVRFDGIVYVFCD